MRMNEMVATTPVPVQKSVRAEEIRVLTSGNAGYILPAAFIPMLREDRVSRGQINVKVSMSETVRPLANAVNVTVQAHYVPFSALDRFEGMDDFNNAWQKKAGAKPLFVTVPFSSTSAFWKTLGVHWKAGDAINAATLECYNRLVNWRRAARSDRIVQRAATDQTLAEAFWKNAGLIEIVPDYEPAMIDGTVPFAINGGRAPVSGIGWNNSKTAGSVVADTVVKETGGGANKIYPRAGMGSTADLVVMRIGDTAPAYAPQIYAELANMQGGLSLANIELAKQTVAWAKMREQYLGIPDDDLIDLLMQGIRVPDTSLRQPILLDRKSTVFGYVQRHATDGASLDQSVTTGVALLQLNIRTPPMNSGGVILITVEVVPEALFERRKDRFLAVTEAEDFPRADRDFLDPEKVEVVKDAFVDVLHSTPGATFGYAPLNFDWKRSLVHAGGRFYRPDTDGFVEDRQRFWASEQKDPKLTEDFYIVKGLSKTVFADQTADPFEILMTGGVEIVGNTVFGPALQEDDGNYAAVEAVVDNSRVDMIPVT